VGLERGPLSLVSTIKKLLERKSGSSGPETENMAISICHTDHVAPSILCRLVGIVRSWTEATEFSLFLSFASLIHHPQESSVLRMVIRYKKVE
jgi:hypothetical protein